MKNTWRWFGKKDSIDLPRLKQIGVEGIVTALHQVPNGQVWEKDAVREIKSYIESFGLEWSVVESLPVSEEIKYGGTRRDELLDRYIRSLENLGQAGIKRVCYNFMPVIDWVRTDIQHRLTDGAITLFFDKIKFAYFEMHILQLAGAETRYSEEELELVEAMHHTIGETERLSLIDSIILKTQGFVNGNISATENDPISKFRNLLSLYDGIDSNTLRLNLKYFLEAIKDVCLKYDMKMCIHPDDPPYPLLGLPRIVGNEADIQWILDAVDLPYNGLTFCSGSLSARLDNNVPKMAGRFAKRTHFVHLRSTYVFPNGNFIEAGHLEGGANIIDVIQAFEKQNPGLPMRVDHGKFLIDDEDKGYNPGYSFLGRMLALGQIQGVLYAIKQGLRNNVNNLAK